MEIQANLNCWVAYHKSMAKEPSLDLLCASLLTAKSVKAAVLYSAKGQRLTHVGGGKVVDG
jgi:hypothetical protein